MKEEELLKERAEMINSQHSEREIYKEVLKLCKYSGTKYSTYRTCPRDRNCKRCEYEQSLVDWKRGEEWIEK